MIKTICSDKNGRHIESETGVFVSTDVSWVRDFTYNGSSSLEKVPVIKLDPDKKYQDILGFGCAFTDASCYVLNELDKDIREKILNTLYSKDGMGFNVGRLTVAQCDYGCKVFSYDDTPGDVDMKDFSIDYDRDYIIPTIKRALDINPDLFLLSSPWSPPGWMKTSGLMTGGWMREKYLEAFSKYYLHFIQEYAKEGIKVSALTTQNESETDQLSLMPACYWHPEHEMSFIRDYLVPLLKKNGLEDIAIWLMDHNYISWRRAKWMLEDPGLRAVVKGTAFHPYGGDASAMTKLHDLFPDQELHMTEWGGPFAETSEGLCMRGAGYLDMMKNWCRTIFCWNLALFETGKPHIGPFFQFAAEDRGGLLQVNSKTHEVKYSSAFWAISHFSKYVKRGAIHIDSVCDVESIKHVAFVNPDGEYVVVLVNAGRATEISLEVKGRYAHIPVSESSMMTLIF
jgi:glucosylceramidase